MARDRGADHRGGRRDHREIVRRVALAGHELEPSAGQPSQQRQVHDARPAVEAGPLGDREQHERGDHQEQQGPVLVVAVRVVPAARELLAEAQADARALVARVRPPARPELAEAAAQQVPRRRAEEPGHRGDDDDAAEVRAAARVVDARREQDERGDADRRRVDERRKDRLDAQAQQCAGTDRDRELHPRRRVPPAVVDREEPGDGEQRYEDVPAVEQARVRGVRQCEVHEHDGGHRERDVTVAAGAERGAGGGRRDQRGTERDEHRHHVPVPVVPADPVREIVRDVFQWALRCDAVLVIGAAETRGAVDEALREHGVVAGRVDAVPDERRGADERQREHRQPAHDVLPRRQHARTERVRLVTHPPRPPARARRRRRLPEPSVEARV